MAIIRVEEEKNSTDSTRKSIKHYILEAINKRIEHFEIIGDYNYKTLALNARMVVSRIFKEYTKPIYREARKELNDKFEEKYAYI